MLLAVAAVPASAQDFYRGKTIDIIVATSPAGGYDQYARLLARHMGKHIPGNPNFVVQNMPGAGGIRAANYLFNVARKDGTVFAVINRETPLIPLLEPGRAGYQFKSEEFNWIGSPQQELGLLILSAKSPAQTLADLKLKTVAVSGTGPGTAPSVYPLVLNDVLGTKFKVVEGYPGSQEALLAVENGEVDGHVSGGSSAAFRGRVNPWIAKGQAKVLIQLGFTKDDAYPAAPLVFDLVQTEKDRQLFELMFTPQLIGRPFLAPPALPADRIATLRSAFDQTMLDVEFLAEARKAQMDINPVSGEDIHKLLARVFALPTDLVERARTIVK
jgi:tripartite-type tricarboxylate transporter receptor subunit TctC